ncbi:MAG: hypothetical protein NTV34_01550, partial [Proteobacteria bacterium]|nr:hypothetical protein [Pseudomonadota bacterium]
MQLSHPFFSFVVTCVIMSSCGKDKNEGSAGGPTAADIQGFSVSELDPARAPVLELAKWAASVGEVDLPTPINLIGQKNALRFSARTMLGLRTSKCDDVAPAVDVIEASGPVLVRKLLLDYSACAKEEFQADGYVIDVSQVNISAIVKVICPESVYDGLNGRSYDDLVVKGDSASSDCTYIGSKDVKYQLYVRTSASVSGKSKENDTFSFANKSVSATYGKTGDCLITTAAAGTTSYKDCIEGSSVIKTGTKGSVTSKDINVTSKIDLTGLKFSVPSEYFGQGQQVPFTVNNWQGTLSFGGFSGGKFDMTNGTDK